MAGRLSCLWPFGQFAALGGAEGGDTYYAGSRRFRGYAAVPGNRSVSREETGWAANPGYRPAHFQL